MQLISIRIVGVLLLTCHYAEGAEACKFDLGKEKFVGTAIEQARCLLPTFPGPEGRRSENGKARDSLGEPLESLIGKKFTLDRTRLRRALETAGLTDFAQSLADPLSRDQSGKSAQYFVLHDTSIPYYSKPFPKVTDPAMARLGFKWKDGTWRAHAFVNRAGQMRVTYDFSQRLPNPAVRLERNHKELIGIFLHTELAQPRKSLPSAPDNDQIIPVPAFLPEQYRSVALLYIAASARAKNWLIPAFHIAIDKQIEGGHDDPQHFDLAQFSAALKWWAARLGG